MEGEPRRTFLADVADNAALGSDGGVVRDGKVSRNPDLAGQDAVFPYLGRTGDPALGRHDGVVPDLDVVRYLAQVVYLHSVPDDGRLHLGAVDGGAGTDLHVVADHDIPQMLDLFP